ncbi:MAG: hypothetical protein ACI3ZQ_02990 [Candidatus Cryptobacteroides sp.]
MKGLFYNIRRTLFAESLLPLLSLLLVLSSCVDELKPGREPSDIEEGEAWVTLDFGADVMPVVSTKASAETENQLFNFYLFIFDMNNGGKQVYGRMFDTDNRRTSTTFDSSADECWYVEYTHTVNGNKYPGGGKVKVKAPLGKNFNIYMIGNLDADMIRISSDLLNHTINSEEDLRNFEVVMNQEVVSRNGYFPMSGSVRGIEVVRGNDGKGHFNIPGTGMDAVLELLRFDAKIQFDFQFNKYNITSFEAKQWQVINVPKTAYVLSYDERGYGNGEATGQDSGNVPAPSDGTDLGAYYSQYAGKFFDTDLVNFEDVNPAGVSSFTFYMLPNRMTPKKPLDDWNIQDASLGAWCERDRQHKLANDKNQMADVSYTTTTRDAVSKRMRIFENANDFSTYVVVTGRVDMVLKEGEQAGQVLGADVQYLIHLGDWTGGKFDNFNVRRNTNYKYTVTINNVDNIRVEVESSRDGETFRENQPGAIGDVVIAKEEIAVCDCHYTTKTMTFHLSNFYSNGNNIANELIWTVDTPFIDDDIVQDGGVPNFPDYEWAHFRINKRENEKSDGTFNYSDKMRKYTPRKYAESTTYRSASDNKEDDGSGADGVGGYHNDGIMDIITLVDYIKRQVALYEQWDKYGGVNTSDFDYSYTDGKRDPVIKMTVFVDEYYYERDPVTHEYDPMLWKKFVNTKDRTMNILCDSNVSKDGESRVTGSVITIQQHSIQTIFDNDNPDLKTAWGLELADEYDGQLEWKNANSNGNDSNENGLLNSVRLWELCGSKSTGFTSGVRWDKYVNFEVNNDIPILNETHKDLRYSCFSRNRDNNGNGIIDREEVRWYMASIQQLIGIYVGDPVLSKSVRLYNRSASQMASKDEAEWMQHVVSSTRFNDQYPIVVWAEEGVSTGIADPAKQEGASANSLRCVRNLGYLDGKSDESYSLNSVSDNFGRYVDAKDSETGNAYFDSEFLNKACFRYETSRELEYHHNNSIENRLVRRFEYCNETVDSSDGTSMKFKELNDNLNEAIRNTGKNPYCPDGYRLPNQRELVILKFFTNLTLPDMNSRTYWIFGSTGEAYEGGLSKFPPYPYQGDNATYKYGFNYKGNITLSVPYGASVKASEVRCVRDVHVD